MLNVGRRCNLACSHCHLSCSPSTTEAMDTETMLASLALIERLAPSLVDVTGGSPELWPHLRELVERLSFLNIPMRMRTNLVALDPPEGSDLAAFLAANGVGLLASLPGTDPEQVNQQRGDIYARCVTVLQHLASLGYGAPDGPPLEIAYNPPAGELPGAESELEQRFAEHFSAIGVPSGRVRAIANVPVGRFGDALSRAGERSSYLDQLAERFNPATVLSMACRRSVEVAWDGGLYDCDFNLGAGLPVVDGPHTVFEALQDAESLVGRRVAFGPHCFACTAGAGSG